MILPKSCKRLAEVDFPIAVVSRHSAREKSIRHGHPSTLHLWWARRPLAACRAVLMGLLLPDPADPDCPEDFRTAARMLLPPVQGAVGPTDLDLRRSLLKFIGDFANWDLASNAQYLAAARGLVSAAHPDETPLVVDPFAGGGSIPLEALRLGCDAFASDLNPVAVLINKVMLEDIPRYGNAEFTAQNAAGEEVTVQGLAEALRVVGGRIKAEAEKELAAFYPDDPDGSRPIAYLWARTVRCEAPNCGAEIPLARSFWLSKKAKRKRALRYRVERGERGSAPQVVFEVFEPKSDKEVPAGTVSRARATCPCCGVVLPPERVRSQLSEQRGGADVIFDAEDRRVGGARLLAVVTLRPSEQGRHYRLPTAIDYQTVWQAQQRLKEVTSTFLPNGLSAVPDEPTPVGGGSGAGRAFSIQKYGMMRWGDLFTARQKLTLTTLAGMIAARDGLEVSSILHLLALALGKTADLGNAGAPWKPGAECPVHLLASQRLPPLWDWAEAVLTAESSGSFYSAYERTATTLESAFNYRYWSGSVSLFDATDTGIPWDSTSVWFTDPPYYDAVPYADLSDFFFVWLKRALPKSAVLKDPFDPENSLTPKTREAVQDEMKVVEGQIKDRVFFEKKMAEAFAEGSNVLADDGIGSVVFAHKTTEGWEALLTGMVRGRWTITGSWPIATEMETRLRARDSAALATSVHLICRPRPDDAPIGDWADVYRELPRRVGDWMERLQREGIRGADLVFACIGPALEIYSRYAKVVDPLEREIPLGGDPTASEPHLRGYLAYVWETVARLALEQVLGTAEAKARNGAAGALEEDARLTALFLWTLQATDVDVAIATPAGEEEDEEIDDEDEETGPRRSGRGFGLPFDVARRFAQPLGIHLPAWEDRIITTDKGVVRLIPVVDRAKQLFGEEGADAVAGELERGASGAAASLQLRLPGLEQDEAPRLRTTGRRGSRSSVADEALRTRREATTLDRIHAAMLLQKAGRAQALRALLAAEQERSPDFLRLANALSALYPRESEEKRLLDAMLLAAPR